MATGTLTGQTIANTYKSLLKITGTTAGGETLHATTLKVIEDGDGNPFPFSAAADAIMINSTNRLEFGDNASYIHQSADGVLDLVSDTEIELTATTIDINGAVDMSSTLAVQGSLTVNEGGGDNDFRVETTGNTHGFFIDAGSNIVNINKPISANDASTPDEVLALKTFYPSAGTDGSAGAGSLLSFYIPDDETNPILGAGIAGLKENADDSNAETALAFYTSQNDATLDEAMRIDSAGDVKLTKDLRVGNWDNGNSHGHAVLYLHADANEGADSAIAFSSGTTDRGYIYYDHNATAASQKMVFNVGDNAVTALEIKGDGSLFIPEYIKHMDDDNTHFRMRDDEIILTTAGNNCINIGTTEVRFNHDQQNIDFAIESNDNGNMFVVDAAENKIAIGGNSRWASPSGSSSGSLAHVTIAGSLRLDSMSTSTGANTDIDSIQFVKAHGSGVGVAQYTMAEIRSFTNGGYEGGLNFWTSASAGGGSYDISKRMVITGPGRVGIKEDSPDAYLHVKNAGGATPALKLEDNSSGVSSSYVLMDIDFSNDADIENGKFIIFQDSDGVMGSISGDDNTTTYATTSDYRKKTDFKDVVDATGTINKLKLYDFAWKKNTDKRAIGVIAHEAEEVFPNAIVGEKDAMTTKIYKDENGDKKEKEVELPQQVDYSKFVPILLKSIQELSAKVEALENA